MGAMQVSSQIRNERMKTNAIGAFGALSGLAVGEFAGTTVGALAAPKDIQTQSMVSIAVKALLGIGVLFFNSLTGGAGLFILGFGWGSIASTVTDLASLAAKGGLKGLAYSSARKLSSGRSAIQSASDVYVESASAESFQQQQPTELVTVAE